MDRSDVCVEDRAKSQNFTKWILLANLRLADRPEYGGFPGLAGVYALRDSRDGDILKYGCTRDLRGRIFGDYVCGAGDEWIHEELFGPDKWINHVEISWIVMDSRAA